MRYKAELYRKHRTEILRELGWKCNQCGSSWRLQIHHKIETLKGEGRGSWERLQDWKKNLNKIELLCILCHQARHLCSHEAFTKTKSNRKQCLNCGKFIK